MKAGKFCEVNFGLNYEDAVDVARSLEDSEWGNEYPDYCGIIDNGSADKMFGNNGYWVAWEDSRAVAFVTNGNCFWGSLDDENDINSIGLYWEGSLQSQLNQHKAKLV